MKDTILEVNNLSVILDREVLLSNVSFSVEKGAALAIIGPNGAGKTLLFRALLSLVPYEGAIKWKEGTKIGYVPQKFHIERDFPLSVKEFFLLKSKNFWLRKKDFVEHLNHELSLAGIEAGTGFLEKRMGELSGGYLQRVLIAWALLEHPDVLLFDEPTTGIDIGAEETIYNILHKLQKERGTTVILISHDLNVVYRHSTEVLCLNKALVCHGVPAKVLNSEQLASLYGEGGLYHHDREIHHINYNSTS